MHQLQFPVSEEEEDLSAHTELCLDSITDTWNGEGENFISGQTATIFVKGNV